MMGTLSMRSGICNILKCLDVKQFTQPHTLFHYQLGLVGVLRSLDHVLRFPCKGKEGKHERHHVFSRWQVSGGGR